MDEKKRIEEIKSGLKKSVYAEAARIKVEYSDDEDSTAKLSNILDGYVEKIDTIDANNLEELEEELRVLKQTNIEVGSIGERDLLVKQYNDYIHNDLERTIAETVEYTYNLNNHTDDLNDILIRPMADEKVGDLNIAKATKNTAIPEVAPDTDELFEIEATTDLGVFEDIVELEGDTLDIAMSENGAKVSIESDIDIKPPKPSKKQKKAPKRDKKKTNKSKDVDFDDDFKDEKGLAAFDYVLIVILIIIFAVLIGLVAKINGVF